MHPIKRPKPTETEEDLLKLEEEFLKKLKTQKVIPAAKVIDKKEGGRADGGDDGSSHSRGGDEGREEMQIEDPNESVLFQVKERAFDASKLKDFTGLKAPPEVMKVKITPEEVNSSSGSGGSSTRRKKSLFAMKFDKERQQNAQKSEETSQKLSGGNKNQSCKAVEHIDEAPSSSGEVIGDKIHPLLAGMTSEDILLEQKKLLERLDPKLIEFIRKRNEQKQQGSLSSANPSTSCSIKEEKKDIMEVEVDLTDPSVRIEEDDLPIPLTSVQGIPGMDKIEMSKLAWTGMIKEAPPLPIPSSVEATAGADKDQEGKSARFDFGGMLLPTDSTYLTCSDPSTFSKALHHHGEEMERPGYTIEELLTLSRSSNLQQRAIGLETLGNIFGRAHTGIYDEFLEKSLFDLLDFMEFIHVVRKGLDNPDSGSINSSLSCLASLLYVEHEECALDATYLWPSSKPFPFLITEKTLELGKDANGSRAAEDMKDFEFLQLDLLEFLVIRTDLLIRMEYLMVEQSERLNEIGVTSLLKILIRIARHSPERIMQHQRLLKYIAEQHISPNWMLLRERQATLKGLPLVSALKLFRVLMESSVSHAMKIYHNYKVMPSVMAYLAYNQWKDQSHVNEVEDLVIESFRIWLSFLSVGVAIDEYISFFPVIMQFLQFYSVSETLNSFDLHHSAYLFALLSQILIFGGAGSEEERQITGKSLSKEKPHSHWELVKDSTSLVEQHCYKILKILAASHLQGAYNLDLALLSLEKGLEFLTLSLKYSQQKENLSKRFLPVLKDFLNSQSYLTLISKLNSHSVILEESAFTSTESEKCRYPSNFSTIGAIRWEGELNPVIRSNSPFHFLSHFIPFISSISDNSIAFNLIFNEDYKKYLARLNKHSDDSRENLDYFVRFELAFISKLLSILPLDFPQRFSVAYKSLSQVPSCSQNLFRSLLKLSLESCCKTEDLEAVYQFYLAYFGISSTLQENLSEEEAASAVAPERSKSTKVKFDDGGHPGDDKMGSSSSLNKRKAKDDDKILFERWLNPRTESHWMFHPLENLYKRVTSSTSASWSDPINLAILEQEARGCLSFIEQCLKHNLEAILQTEQDLVTVYCRICRVFMLGNPAIYIDERTAPILQNILQILSNSKLLKAKSRKKPVFSQHKPSRSAAVSFFDFYSELVGEYFDNSYFNETFASFLFLPIKAEEDSRVKQCFWGHEHISFLRLTKDKVPISLEYLTGAPEKDQNMLGTYTRLIKSNRITPERNPFLYEVATEHLRNSKEFMTEELRKDFETLLKI